MPTNRSNDDWLRDLRAADQSAVADLHSRLMRGLSHGLRGKASMRSQDIEDFAQEAVVRVLDRIDDFRGDSKFMTWATAIGIRIALTAVRKKSWGTRSLEELTEAGSVALLGAAEVAPDRSAAWRDMLSVLNHAIETVLTDRQRAMILGELAGMPSSVLAEQLDTNTNALYKLYHDARKKLRKALLEAGFDENDVRSELSDASG